MAWLTSLVLTIGFVLFASASAASSPASGPTTPAQVCAADEMDLCSDSVDAGIVQMCSADEMDLCSDEIFRYSQEQWESTVHMFEDQPMISQKITKEFLMSITVTGHTNGSSANASAGHRLLAGAAAGSATSSLTSIELFDKHIAQLTQGDPARKILSAAQMGPLVQTALEDLKAVWVPFKAFIQKNTNGEVAASDVLLIALESRKLLKASELVMEYIVIMEMAAGAQEEGMVVTIARKQTVLMQEMLVEVLLISLGVDVAHSIHLLHQIEISIDGSNRGIILGAPWAGVPTLRKFCTLAEMTKVTAKWAIAKPFMDAIIGSNNPQETAKKSVHDAITAGDDLEHEMEVAVALYMHDDGSCSIVDDITTADWKYLLNSVDLQRYYGQHLALQVLQVANNISIQASKVDLTINRATTYSSLRILIEGNAYHSSPPTQQIADQLIASMKVWEEISGEFETVIFTDVVDPIMVAKVIRLAAQLLHNMDKVMASYMEVVALKKTPAEVPAYLIATSGHQRTYLEEMALEASEILFYEDHNMKEERSRTMDLLNATRDHFLTSHWALLRGDPANNVSEMTNLCIIKKMKEVKDQFDLLEAAAWRVAYGEKEQMKEMRLISPIAHELMNTAAAYYSNGVETCPEVEPTLEEWQAGIVAAGQVRSSSQTSCTQYLWDMESLPGPNPGDVLADFWGADGTIGEGMVLAITKLRFGWGVDSIPAPYNEKMREDIAHVNLVVTNFSRDLLLDSAADVAFNSNAMLEKAQFLVNSYLQQAAIAFPTMPVNRIELSTRLDYLANKMLKEALLVRLYGSGRLASASPNHNYTIVTSNGDVTRTMNEYNNVANMLKDGAPYLGVPPVVRQREDIENQQARVAMAYTVFKDNVLCVSDPYCKATLTTKQSLEDLEKEIAAATSLYYLLDPTVPESYPWTVVIYITVAVLVVGVVGFACWRGLRESKK